MGDEDLMEVMKTGERLPASMFDANLLAEKDAMILPVFNGDNVVDQAKE